MKAIALFSGGMDSTLALRIIIKQGIEVIAVNFITPFCLCNGKKGCKKDVKKMIEVVNTELKIINISEEYLKILKNPHYGYGKNLNPCIDCRILMFKKAKELMDKIGASFIITGEVLGQRPMSQNKKAIKIIENQSGLEGLIVRPLSAKLLPLSIPEQKGWIKRENLLEISGRSRKNQYGLIQQFNISNYFCPAGGCLLTDPIFSLRIKDLLISNMLNIDNINLVKNGRYFRINDVFKLIVGRNQTENQVLLALAKKGDLVIEPTLKAPIAIGRGKIVDEVISIALRIIAYYCKNTDSCIEMNFGIFPEKKNKKINTNKIDKQELVKYMVI